MLQTSVLTHLRIPQPMQAACSEARCAVYRSATDLRSDDRLAAWRLLFAMDRLLFWRSPTDRGRDTRARKLTANLTRGLAWFWAGEWQILWDPAHVCGASSRSATSSVPTLQQQASRIERTVVEGQISKAVGAIRVPLGLEGDARALGLFACSSRAVLAMRWNLASSKLMRSGVPLFVSVLTACSAACPRAWALVWTAHASNSGNPSTRRIPRSTWQLAALNTGSREVDAVLRRGRLLALQKKAGCLRPLLLAASFRRIALKAARGESPYQGSCRT